MAKYLVLFTDQLNEIEINGFKVMTEKEVETLEELAASITWDFTYPISTGELEYLNGEDFLSRLEFKEVSFDENKMLKKLFNCACGVFIGIDYLETLIDEEDDSLLDDEEDEYENNDLDDYNEDY